MNIDEVLVVKSLGFKSDLKNEGSSCFTLAEANWMFPSPSIELSQMLVILLQNFDQQYCRMVKPNVVPQISIMRFNTYILFNPKQNTR